MGLGWKSLSASGAPPFWQTLAADGSWTNPVMSFVLTRCVTVSAVSTPLLPDDPLVDLQVRERYRGKRGPTRGGIHYGIFEHLFVHGGNRVYEHQWGSDLLAY